MPVFSEYARTLTVQPGYDILWMKYRERGGWPVSELPDINERGGGLRVKDGWVS